MTRLSCSFSLWVYYAKHCTKENAMLYFNNVAFHASYMTRFLVAQWNRYDLHNHEVSFLQTYVTHFSLL